MIENLVFIKQILYKLMCLTPSASALKIHKDYCSFLNKSMELKNSLGTISPEGFPELTQGEVSILVSQIGIDKEREKRIHEKKFQGSTYMITLRIYSGQALADVWTALLNDNRIRKVAENMQAHIAFEFSDEGNKPSCTGGGLFLHKLGLGEKPQHDQCTQKSKSCTFPLECQQQNSPSCVLQFLNQLSANL